jgi:hypothetical protein
MPILKDKYGKKGQQIRSKYQTREINKAIEEISPTGLSTEQKKQIEVENYRNSSISNQQVSRVTQSLSSVAGISSSKDQTEERDLDINSFTFLSADSISLLFKLSAGQSVNDIIIHNYNSVSKDCFITLYWTIGDQDNASFTVSHGIVTAFTGIPYLARVFGSNFPPFATVSLGDILSNTFKNTNKDIYFYVSSLLAGPSITYSKG